MITLFTCLIILQFAISVSHDLIARRSTLSRKPLYPSNESKGYTREVVRLQLQSFLLLPKAHGGFQ
jgi:hypothetical protein